LELGEVRVDSLQVLSEISQVNFVTLTKTPGGPFDSEVCVESAHGKRWLAISHRALAKTGERPFPPDQDNQLQSIWILRDVTAIKHAEQEREAARRATTLAEISTILAHEIRNPLAGLELFAGLIEQDPSDASQWISHLRAGIRSLSGTVNNVLSLNGAGKPHLAALRLADCVANGVDFVRPIAGQAGVTITFSGAKNSPSIIGNEDAIRQIVTNIACNAIRHTADGGTVTVSTRAAQRNKVPCALVTIQDTGCGIPAELTDRIFDAGFSGTGETPGLGLAVCKRLMQLHGGEIRVSSRVNVGTTFELEFPVL